ncbi:hypothetical protein LTR51_005909 [Lithohypha guttulata]|nr:hypothetical protein LTR51_005909 [Lithohypha guttulata]
MTAGGGSRVSDQPSIQVEACVVHRDLVKNVLPVQVATPTPLGGYDLAVSCVKLGPTTHQTRGRWSTLLLAQMSTDGIPNTRCRLTPLANHESIRTMILGGTTLPSQAVQKGGATATAPSSMIVINCCMSGKRCMVSAATARGRPVRRARSLSVGCECVEVLDPIAPVGVVRFDGDGLDGSAWTEKHTRAMHGLMQGQERQVRELGAQFGDYVRAVAEQVLQSWSDTTEEVVGPLAHHHGASKEAELDGGRDAREGLLHAAPYIALDVQLLQAGQEGQVDKRPARSSGLRRTVLDRDLESAQACQRRKGLCALTQGGVEGQVFETSGQQSLVQTTFGQHQLQGHRLKLAKQTVERPNHAGDSHPALCQS